MLNFLKSLIGKRSWLANHVLIYSAKYWVVKGEIHFEVKISADAQIFIIHIWSPFPQDEVFITVNDVKFHLSEEGFSIG